ncbi:MAG: hypothetical protein QM802_20170 [Agriterribacter sp.]
MTMTSEELKVLREFNNNINWLRKKELKEEFTASAGDVMKITGWSRERLRGERERGTVKCKKAGKQYRFDLRSLPEVYKQKVIHSNEQQAPSLQLQV